MEYLILTDQSPTYLTEKVNIALKSGWALQGGVSVGFKSGDISSFIYAQAVIRKR